MQVKRPIMSAAVLFLAMGCQETVAPDSQPLQEDALEAHRSRHYRPDIHARGHGVYLIESLDIEVKFRFFMRQEPYESAEGRFRHSLIFQDQLVSFDGRVTCLAYDRDNGRLWVGGVITRNRSEHPGFTGEIHQPGKDVWFRLLDTGRRSNEADRTTFLGFEGGGGIITSAEYCEAKIWPGPPDDVENARTNPVVKGKIRVY